MSLSITVALLHIDVGTTEVDMSMMCSSQNAYLECLFNFTLLVLVRPNSNLKPEILNQGVDLTLEALE